MVLNQNQRRHLAVAMHMLLLDLAALADMPELQRESDLYTSILDQVRGVREAVDAIVETVGLVRPEPPTLRRRVQAIADVWAMRVGELYAHQLKGYGRVHPDLSGRLDPLVDELRTRLYDLATSAGRLPVR